MEALHSLKQKCRQLDRQVSEINSKIQHTRNIKDNDDIRYESWSKFYNIKSEVTGLTEECTATVAKLKRNNANLAEHRIVSERCLQMIENQIKSFEMKFSSQGYIPNQFPYCQAPIPVDEENNVIMKDLSNFNSTDDKQIETNKLKDGNSESDDTNDAEGNENLRSPTVPLLQLNRKKSELLHSPAIPCIGGTKKDQFFPHLSSPANIDDQHQKSTPSKAVSSNALFPLLVTPEAPKLKLMSGHGEASAQYYQGTRREVQPANAVQGKSDSSDDDDQLVLHSRRSFLANYQNDDAPDVTITQLKKAIHHQPDALMSPDTPDLQKTGLMGLAIKNKRNFTSVEDTPESIFESPAAPKLGRFTTEPTPTEPVSPSRRRSSSYWVDDVEYERLPASMKRLFTIEQANAALHSMRMELSTSRRSGLTLGDIQDATSLGGKTQSLLLLLTTVGAVRKLPGSTLYSVID